MARKSVAGTVEDPTIRFSTLEVGGEKYSLAYSFNSIAKAESVAGCNLLKGLDNLTELTAMELRGLLYAALSIAHPAMTIEQAGALIRPNNLVDIASALAKAYQLSMPEKKADPTEAGVAAES